MAKKITKIDELNELLLECFNEIKSVGASTKGNKFDETVRDKLQQFLPGAKYIKTEDWCSKKKKSIYYNYQKITSKNQFNFKALPPILDNGEQLNLMIIDKPNGSQKWPDLLVVFNGIGLPIEVKSTKNDVIVWNGGLPKHDTLYVYNCYGKSKTTFFLGQHAITNDELLFLREKAKFMKSYNEKHGNNRWDYYIRNMNNSNQSFFENDNDRKKIKELEKKINSNNIAIEEFKIQISNKKSDSIQKKIEKIQSDNINNNDIIINLTNKYYIDKKKRDEAEQAAKNMILSLTWNNSQKTDFNDDLS